MSQMPMQPEDPMQQMMQSMMDLQAQAQDGEDPSNALEDELDPGTLGQAVRDAWDRLQPFRSKRVECIEKYVGRHYGDVTSTDAQYVNLIQQAVETLLPQIESYEPKCHVEPVSSGLIIDALVRELSLNRLAKGIGLAEIHSQVVLDALFAPFGIVRTGIKASDDQVMVGDKIFNRGEFFVDHIDFEDYVCDQVGRTPRDRVFEGHRIRVPRSAALAAESEPGVPLYDPDVIKAASRLTIGKPEPNEADQISGFSGDPFDLVDMIEIWQIYVYLGDRTMVYTLTDLSGQKWAREPYEHWGPESGPYIKLGFFPVPSNSIPQSYASRILDLHEAASRTANRFIEGMDRTKVTHVYRSGEEDLAAAVRDSKDNEFIKGDPTAITSVKSGGIVPELQPGMQFVMELFNNASGSSQLLGGQADIAKTATAATILQGNAQARLSVMDSRSKRVLTKVFEHAAWYQDNDPMLEETLMARMPGGVTMEFVNRPDLREGKYTDFIFTVDAYSSKPVDPAVKLDKLMQAMQMLVASAQLGPNAFAKVAQILAKELQIPEIDEISPDPAMFMARQAVVQNEGGPAADDPVKRPEQKKSNVRQAPFQQGLGQARSAYAGAT